MGLSSTPSELGGPSTSAARSDGFRLLSSRSVVLRTEIGLGRLLDAVREPESGQLSTPTGPDDGAAAASYPHLTLPTRGSR